MYGLAYNTDSSACKLYFHATFIKKKSIYFTSKATWLFHREELLSKGKFFSVGISEGIIGKTFLQGIGHDPYNSIPMQMRSESCVSGCNKQLSDTRKWHILYNLRRPRCFSSKGKNQVWVNANRCAKRMGRAPDFKKEANVCQKPPLFCLANRGWQNGFKKTIQKRA